MLNLLEDENDELWVGTQGGLNRFDRETRTFVRYLADASDPSSLSSNRIHAMETFHDGDKFRFWLGTRNGPQ